MFKKVCKVMVVFLSCLFMNEVKADEWTTKELEGDAVIKEIRYRYYYLVKNGEYKRVDEMGNYSYSDKNDIKYGEFSSWTNSPITEYDYLDIEYGKKYEYQELLPAQYIKIENVTDSNISINDIETYNLSVKLNHKIYSCTLCNSDKNIIYPNGNMIIYMPMSVLIKNLTFNFTNDSNSNFEIYYSFDRAFNKIVASTLGNNTVFSYKYNKAYKLYENYSNTFVGYNINVDEFIKVISVSDVCRAREIYDYKYNLDKVYFGTTYYKDKSDIDVSTTDLSIDDLYMDENDYQIYYKYSSDVGSGDNKNNNDNNTPSNIIPINSPSLVKTGNFKLKNTNYLITYILLLLLVTLLFIKRMNKKRNFK